MKKLITWLFFCCFLVTGAVAQLNQVKIVSFSVKSQLPAKPDDWGPGSLLLTAQQVPGNKVRELKLVLQLKSNGALVCGNNTTGGAFVGDITTRTFNNNDLVSMLGGCKELKEGSYTLCAQFVNIDRVAVSQEMCRDFRVEVVNNEYQPPTLINPENGKKYSPEDMKKPLVFRWTPLVPKPKDQVTYRLRVWQLMQGQNAPAAVKANAPIVEKEVTNLNQATITNLYTGPCRPPYLCDFAWQVQALNREGKPIGNNEGKSEIWVFKVQNNIDTEIDSLKVGCCENGKQSIYIRVKNNLANNARIIAIKYKINGAGASIPLAPLVPALSVIIPGNGSQVFTGSINCIDNLNYLKFLVDAEDVADPDNKETEVASDTLKCICKTCDSVKIQLPTTNNIQTDANGNVTLGTSITITPKPVKSIKAELVYFEYKPESEECMVCNKDSKTMGNFLAAAFNNTAIGLPYPHTAAWQSGNANGQMVSSVPLQFTISTPPTVKCCAAEVKWCIRYVITFADCTVCNKLVCYSFTKKCACN